ncbi:hypothetical protein [Pontibacter sp. G13]|uniref:hypothetical protein n=1 Tax=Pontibacter sp. G13 TaxID=3074898 RepID=UPI00288B17E1|nr:hypothetical protein [Pontibacter sp. G13]WNJ17236.1 hypothetical protein RJD25_20465 [Pontibacter sp. G13]
MNRIFALGIAMMGWLHGLAQDDNLDGYVHESTINLMVGYQVFSNHYLELGVAKRSTSYAVISTGGFLGGEVRLGEGWLLGPKIGVWYGGVLAAGAQLIAYTDLDKFAFRLRPEIGLGAGPAKFTYGYNIPLNASDFPGINSHCVSLTFFWDFR